MERRKAKLKTSPTTLSGYTIVFTTQETKELSLIRKLELSKPFSIPQYHLAERIKYPSKGYQGL